MGFCWLISGLPVIRELWAAMLVILTVCCMSQRSKDISALGINVPIVDSDLVEVLDQSD